MPFVCSICEEESTKICAFCTKDSCDNHLCQRCGCCSDCCECEVPLDEAASHPHVSPVEAEHAGTPTHAAPPEPPSPEANVQPEASLPVPDEPSPELPETPEV